MELQEILTPTAIAGVIGGLIGAMVNALIGAVRGAWTIRRETKEEPYRQRLDVDLSGSRIVNTSHGDILEVAIGLTNVGNVALKIADAKFGLAPKLVIADQDSGTTFSQALSHDEPDIYSFDSADEIPGLELLPGESATLFKGVELNEGLLTPIIVTAYLSSGDDDVNDGEKTERDWPRSRLVFDPESLDNRGTK